MSCQIAQKENRENLNALDKSAQAPFYNSQNINSGPLSNLQCANPLLQVSLDQTNQNERDERNKVTLQLS